MAHDFNYRDENVTPTNGEIFATKFGHQEKISGILSKVTGIVIKNNIPFGFWVEKQIIALNAISTIFPNIITQDQSSNVMD